MPSAATTGHLGQLLVDTNNWGERIRERRKALRMSQAELAAHLGITQNQISKYERGVDSPSIENLIKMVNLFETTADYLLGLSPMPELSKLDVSPAEAEMIALMRHYTETGQTQLLEIVQRIHAMRDE